MPAGKNKIAAAKSVNSSAFSAFCPDSAGYREVLTFLHRCPYQENLVGVENENSNYLELCGTRYVYISSWRSGQNFRRKKACKI